MNREIQAVGLDIGTSRVRCVIGEPDEHDGKLNIIGIGQAESRGLRRGIVTTTDTVAESIKKAVEEAEHISGLEIQMATINLSGEHLRGENKSGVVAVAGAGREISEEDVERAVESASAMQLPAGWEILTVCRRNLLLTDRTELSSRSECAARVWKAAFTSLRVRARANKISLKPSTAPVSKLKK